MASDSAHITRLSNRLKQGIMGQLKDVVLNGAVD